MDDPGFPGGHQPPRRGTNLLFDQFFFRNRIKIKKNLALGVHVALALTAPPPPPPKSGNSYFLGQDQWSDKYDPELKSLKNSNPPCAIHSPYNNSFQKLKRGTSLEIQFIQCYTVNAIFIVIIITSSKTTYFFHYWPLKDVKNSCHDSRSQTRIHTVFCHSSNEKNIILLL